ncbi:MAG TPA: 7-cyano-7-deazaguanine synthase QueC [Alphaproteobacteria bacterium]|jgi:7-cyano-7-deazaguanine synthase
MTKAVVLLSGGLDSATALAIAQSRGFEAHALTFAYGQRHAVEIEAARKIAAAAKVARHIVLPIDLRVFGGSALTDDIAVPKGRDEAEMASAIPVTYVPARNTIFLSFALAWAEVLGARDIFIGVNALDYSGYPDCRPEFVAAFQHMANLATKAAVEASDAGESSAAKPHLTIHSPLMDCSKADIVAKGLALGVDFSLTRSCYDPTPDGFACGECDSCRLRLKGFAVQGLADPAPYRKTP